MLDVAWPELVVIGAVALVAIGPKDLPRVMHNLGRWVAKARSFAHHFQNTLDQLSYEAEIADKLRRDEAEKKSPDSPEAKTSETKTPAGHDGNAAI